jgi:hypothetical protein
LKKMERIRERNSSFPIRLVVGCSNVGDVPVDTFALTAGVARLYCMAVDRE